MVKKRRAIRLGQPDNSDRIGHVHEEQLFSSLWMLPDDRVLTGWHRPPQVSGKRLVCELRYVVLRVHVSHQVTERLRNDAAIPSLMSANIRVTARVGDDNRSKYRTYRGAGRKLMSLCQTFSLGGAETRCSNRKTSG